ncbi:MAG: class I SAM-dependent methyltransferase [Rhodobacteraceae bacterium]|nr:class I SAM-dependent methyltransferase [Paracoccaceae bacterium]
MSQTDRLSLPFETGQIEVPEEGSIAAIRARPSQAYDLFPRDRFFAEQGFKPTHDALTEAGYRTSGPTPDNLQLAIVHLTRSRDENRARIASAFLTLQSGGLLVVDGAKTEGVDSVLKAVKTILNVDGVLSKAHGKVFWLRKSDVPAELWEWQRGAEIRQNNAGYWTSSGMFSPDKIDKGSAELAPLLAGQLTGRGADLGAGWGWLAAQALDMNPQIVVLDMFEAEGAAVYCASKNLTDPRGKPHWADVNNLSSLDPYDFVIMNPPFHQSRKAEPAIGQQFIQSAARLLKPSGKLYMVANRQLAYERTLDDCFNHWEQLSQTGQFKCILARKPKR